MTQTSQPKLLGLLSWCVHWDTEVFEEQSCLEKSNSTGCKCVQEDKMERKLSHPLKTCKRMHPSPKARSSLCRRIRWGLVKQNPADCWALEKCKKSREEAENLQWSHKNDSAQRNTRNHQKAPQPDRHIDAENQNGQLRQKLRPHSLWMWFQRQLCKALRKPFSWLEVWVCWWSAVLQR